MAIVLISGSTASLKKDVRNKLAGAYGYQRIVSMTTRKPLPYETSRDYIFTEFNAFELLKSKGLFLEVINRLGYQYGIKTAEITYHVDNYKNSIIVATPDGIAKIRKYLTANSVAHVAVYISENPERVVKQLTERRDRNSLSEGEFIEKMTNYAMEEIKWSDKAMTSNYFDLIFQTTGKECDVDSIASAINDHVHRLNRLELNINKAIELQVA